MVVYGLVAYTTLTLPSCDTKDDELWERVDELFERVEKLEDLCSQMNTDIHSIQSIINAIQNNYSITSVTSLDNEKGYVITFNNGEKITIYHGKDGADGKNGENGKNGTDGKDGNTPTISIKDIGNGQYVWLLNGEILCDEQGNPIPINGKDGKDGQDGKDGEDGKDGHNGSSAPTPIVKTGSELISSGVDGSWDRDAVYISVNRGATWTQISSNNSGSIFSSIDTSNAGYITITLTNGIQFTIPRTDDLTSMIIGKWFLCDGGYPNYNYRFSKNGTYSYYNNAYNYIEDGTYEVLKDRNSIILCDETKSEELIDIIPVNEYLLKWVKHGYSEIGYLYRHDAFIFEKSEINAPQEGGTFTIQVDAKFLFKVSNDNSNYIENGNTNNIYSTINSKLSFTTSATDNSIVVTIEPNMSNLNLTGEFYIEDTYGNRIATITINQEKNTEVVPNKISLSEWGKSYVSSLFYEADYIYKRFTNMGWDYTSSDNSDFKPKLSPNNGTLANNWTEVYRVINQINQMLNQAEQELHNGPLKTPLETLRAILYYNLAVYWGNVCYMTEENLDNIYSVQQLTTTQLFEKLTPQLTNAINVLEERAYRDEGSNDFYLSKDVARMALAQIHMYMGKYSDAELLLQKIKDNKFYSYNSIRYIFTHGYRNNRIVLYSYTELLLSLSECKLNGDTPADADIFINEILDEYNLNIESTDKKQIMKEIFLETNIHDGYFAFLKRNGIAKETIGITEDYQLLFPIPQSELYNNPSMIQNSGY